jgi:hypothetical protein
MPEQFIGRIDIRDDEAHRTIELDGDTGIISAGGNHKEGHIFLFRTDGDLTRLNSKTVDLDGQEANLRMGGNLADGDIDLRGGSGKRRIHLDAGTANLMLGGNDEDGDLLLFDRQGDNVTVAQAAIHLNGGAGSIRLGGHKC